MIGHCESAMVCSAFLERRLIVRITGKLRYKNAIVIDEDFIKEIDELLLDYFGKVEYESGLINGDKVVFSSGAELMEYKNYGYYAIKNLSISFGIGNRMYIESQAGLFTRYRSTIKMTFETDGSDECERLKRKVQDIFEQHKQPAWYDVISKISSIDFMIGVLLVELLVVFVSYFAGVLDDSSSEMSAFGILLSLLITLCLWSLSFFFSNFCLARLLPEIEFYIGKNIEKVDRRKALRGHIFWGIIVTIAVSVLVKVLLG